MPDQIPYRLTEFLLAATRTAVIAFVVLGMAVSMGLSQKRTVVSMPEEESVAVPASSYPSQPSQPSRNEYQEYTATIA
jgi:hypothetical protein